jgi:hypothetical protein
MYMGISRTDMGVLLWVLSLPVDGLWLWRPLAAAVARH